MKSNEFQENFPSKIMLFGEYTILKGSDALTIPFAEFSGNLEFNNYSGREKTLDSLFKFLQNSADKVLKKYNFPISLIESDINNGLIFKSSIPQGYGLGSSGALVAALYSRYASTIELNINELKQIFASIESFFHGHSSGIDPLTSYLKKPLLFRNNEVIGLNNSLLENAGISIFLINTHAPRNTSKLVKYFYEMYTSHGFRKMLKNELIPEVNSVINGLVISENENIYNRIGKISRLQQLHFQFMIPNSYIDLWEQGIYSGNFYLKLCGAGGGGFLLGFTQKDELVMNLEKDKKIDITWIKKATQ